METTKFKTKISLIETLRNLPIGGEIEIFQHEFKCESIRCTATALNKEGMKFNVSCKNRTDGVLVTRKS